MKIFLDIDGVLVPANSWRPLEILDDGFANFNVRSVHALNFIIDKTHADIVLTTSHKNSFTLDQWLSIFRKRNVKVFSINKLTSNSLKTSRKEELMSWFLNNNIKEDYLIIDDDKSLNNLPVEMKNHLIQTSGSVGLTMYLAKNALKDLNHHLTT